MDDERVYFTDGTSDGTGVLLEDGIQNPRALTVLQNVLFFQADTANGKVELWSSDGTPSGTSRQLIAWPEEATDMLQQQASSEIMARQDSQVFVAGGLPPTGDIVDPVYLREVWAVQLFGDIPSSTSDNDGTAPADSTPTASATTVAIPDWLLLVMPVFCLIYLL